MDETQSLPENQVSTEDTGEFLAQIDQTLRPLLSEMIVDYKKTALACDRTYYTFSAGLIIVTALIPALSAFAKGVPPWVVPTLGIIAAVLAGLQARFRFEERGQQWTTMLIEFEALQAQWDLFKLKISHLPLDQARSDIVAEARRIVDRIAELERRDVSAFYKSISLKHHG